MKKMGFGMMRLPQTDKNDFSNVDQEQVNKMADKFIEAGYTYFDTAYPYHDGNSEVALRKAVVERYPRDSFVIADKLPLFAITKEEELEPIFQEQLKRCGVDYFDYYLLHNASGFSEAGFIGVNSFEFAIQKKKEGKIKHLGLSSHANAEYIENLLKKYPEMEFIQLQINYLDWENEGVEARKCYEVARKYELPIVIMEPLKGGFLANLPEEAQKLMEQYNDDKPVAWALKYDASLEGVFMVLSGASSLEQMEENIEIFENFEPITDEQQEIIDKVVKIINSQITVPCTKCKYCINACPKNINIPKLFDWYNNQKIENVDIFTAVGNAYVNYSKIEGNGIASDCISCGLCEKECPQHIKIPEVMKDVKETFEIPLYGFSNE
ncbi:aldo/keto reductase [Methanosphaera sp. ISO3-F5]|uniref:aldo/keto reductase n=1 Tax=Methanosphaera sp. ISO3-F5 TaxID=1452353 RepID=UPI002B256D9D|nr:aldo/keto reductase [Methanosphaera sp. ISO3-F5]WQH64201.1 aldo/keto reductase [Methanosphaera sp. ISO3-F5]